MKNQYFSLVTFILLISLGLLILNIKERSFGMSILFIFFMLFSRFLYTKSAIGFYDHDYVGMCGFFILILFYYIGNSFYLLTPLIIYALSFIWDGLVPVAYLFTFIIFIEYLSRKRNLLFNILKYPLYLVLIWMVIRNSFDPSLFVKETIFNIFYIILIVPFIGIGLWLSQKEWLWQGSLVFAIIALLHSSRTVVIAYPIIFLAICMILKKSENKGIIATILVCVFLISQIGNYLQLERFGTELTDEGMYYLRDNAKKDAKILAWWDYGYYIEYMSKRDSIYGGNPENPGLDKVSVFFCTGAIPTSFDYFVNFIYQSEIIPTILSFKKNNCTQDMPYIYSIKSDTKRFKLVFSNNDVEIYRRVG